FSSCYPDHPHLHSLPTRRSSDLKILTAISSNSGPDVFYAIPDMMADYKAKGILAPMDEYLDKNDLRDFNDNALAAARHEGKLYRSEEHTSELQSREKLVCRLLLE